MPVVCVAALTTKVKPFPAIAPILPANDPLPQRGQILAFQVLTIDQARLDGYMASISRRQLEELKRALRLVWDL
jgi:mRNA-degrading endonuclease toxin of MazEF toxin-antitoxin module